jgi:hypothetical protein
MPSVPHPPSPAQTPPPEGAATRRRNRIGSFVTLVVASVLAGCSGPAALHQAAGPQHAAKHTQSGVPKATGTPGPPGPHFTSNGVLSTCQSTAVTSNALYIGSGHTIHRIDARTGRSELLATTINSICGIAIDKAGNILFAGGTQVQVLAGANGRFYGQAMQSGREYTIAGSRTADRHDQGLGDNGPARKAGYGRITGLSVDPAGNVLISDSGRRDCHGCDDMGSLVRVIATRAGRFYAFGMKAGHSYTVAGIPSGITDAGHDHGPATGNSLGDTLGAVTTDSHGNLIIADPATPTLHPPFAPMVRVVPTSPGHYYDLSMKPGHIYTIAGNGHPGTTRDGTPANLSPLALATGAAVDPDGNIVVADNARLLVIAAATGRFYGQHMTKGDIYTIAGTGTLGSTGDGGLARQAPVSLASVAIDTAGNLILGPADPAAPVRVIAASPNLFYGVRMLPWHIYGLGTSN